MIYEVYLEGKDLSRVTPCTVDAVQLHPFFGCQEELRNTNKAYGSADNKHG